MTLLKSNEDIDWKLFVVILVVAVICLIAYFYTITDGFYNKYLDPDAFMPIRNWITTTRDCEGLGAYVIGDPNSPQVQEWFNPSSNGVTWNMAKDKQLALINGDMCE